MCQVLLYRINRSFFGGKILWYLKLYCTTKRANTVRPYKYVVQFGGVVKNNMPKRWGGGTSRAPSPTFGCYSLPCRKIASLFADFTLYKDIVKAVQSFVLRHRFGLLFSLCFFFCFLHRLVGLRLLRLCLKLRNGLCPLTLQWVSPLDPDQGRAPGPFARFARCFLNLAVALC